MTPAQKSAVEARKRRWEALDEPTRLASLADWDRRNPPRPGEDAELRAKRRLDCCMSMYVP